MDRTGREVSSLSVGPSGAGDYLAGRFALDTHDLPTASSYLLSALSHDPENIELLQKSLLSLAAEGRMREAAKISRRLLNYESDAGLATLLVVEQDAKAGHWQEVENRIAALPRRGANAFLAPLVTAWARIGQGQTDAALTALDPLSQTSNFTALHDFHAALIADLAGRQEMADQYYRSTLAGDAGQTLRATEAVVSFYRRSGQAAKAAEFIENFDRQHGGVIDADWAHTLARPVENAEAGLAEAFFGAAGTWRQANVPELALVFGRMALDLKPDFPMAQLIVGDTWQELGRLKEANELLVEVPSSAPIYWTAQLRLASNLDDLGDVDGAIKTLEALAEHQPARLEGLVTLGDILRRHERWAEAVTAYDRALTLPEQAGQGLWAVYYSRGIALERSKQWPRAEADLMKALELRPDEPHVLNYLGYSWIDQGVNLERAQRMIERAVAQRPTDGFIVDSLGWAYYRTGNTAKAVESLERAVELRPDDATINDHLGDALWGVGRHSEALFQWQRALTFSPDAELKTQIQRKLSNGGLPPVQGAAANVNAAK